MEPEEPQKFGSLGTNLKIGKFKNDRLINGKEIFYKIINGKSLKYIEHIGKFIESDALGLYDIIDGKKIYYTHDSLQESRLLDGKKIYYKIKKIKEEILELQNIFEEKHPKNKDWSKASRKNLQRYSKVGCGYGEGGALSVVLTNHKFKFKELNQKNPI